MKVKVKVIQTDIYEKEMEFDIDIEVTDDKEVNEHQARKQIIEEIQDGCINLSLIKDTFTDATTEIEFLEWKKE